MSKCFTQSPWFPFMLTVLPVIKWNGSTCDQQGLSLVCEVCFVLQSFMTVNQMAFAGRKPLEQWINAAKTAFPCLAASCRWVVVFCPTAAVETGVYAVMLMSANVCSGAEPSWMWRDAATLRRRAEPHRHAEGSERSIWKVWRCGRGGAAH